MNNETEWEELSTKCDDGLSLKKERKNNMPNRCETVHETKFYKDNTMYDLEDPNKFVELLEEETGVRFEVDGTRRYHAIIKSVETDGECKRMVRVNITTHRHDPKQPGVVEPLHAVSADGKWNRWVYLITLPSQKREDLLNTAEVITTVNEIRREMSK